LMDVTDQGRRICRCDLFMRSRQPLPHQPFFKTVVRQRRWHQRFAESPARSTRWVKLSTYVDKVKFQLDFTAGIFIALLEPSRLSEHLESATQLPGKNRYAEDRTRVGGLVASMQGDLTARPPRVLKARGGYSSAMHKCRL